VRDATGSFDAVLWVCAALLVCLTVLVTLLPRREPRRAAAQARVGG
jgi:hypothetical protein